MRKRQTTEEFIIKAISIHGDKYDYSKTVYGKNNREKVIIICKKHKREFKQTPHHHLHRRGCELCGIEKRACALEKSANNRRKTTEQFIIDAKKYTAINMIIQKLFME